MIVRFDSKAGGFIMMGDVARELIRMMGHSGVIPSALLAKDIPSALEKLRTAVAAAPVPPEPEPPGLFEEPKERPVSMRQRAFPLVDLLERSQRKGCDVLWTIEPPGSPRT
ncbi:MAG: DUF1840 domain-containing protein [Burkholderiales bacterium]